jgi:hypothetical protein
MESDSLKLEALGVKVSGKAVGVMEIKSGRKNGFLCLTCLAIGLEWTARSLWNMMTF